MENMSFTDEQLLNLVNNTILTKSDFDIKEFTGGGVQITSTYNHKVIKHKIYLTFGYDEKRNSKSYSEDIEDDISFIWQKAILLKVKSMQVLKTGSSLSDLNKLMNTDNKIEDRDNKIEIEDRDRDRARNSIVTTSLRNKKTTSKKFKTPTIEEIQEYIIHKNYNVNVDTFFNFYESNGWMVGKNKMKSWKASVAVWNSKETTKQQAKPYNTPTMQQLNTDVNIWDAIEAQTDKGAING